MQGTHQTTILVVVTDALRAACMSVLTTLLSNPFFDKLELPCFDKAPNGAVLVAELEN